MGEPGFYESTNSQSVLKQFGDVKTQLESAMEEWETAQEKLEEFNR